MSRYIICGAPCAGKSTFVRERFKPGDLIYDYDSLHTALSGCESHEHLNAIRPYVIAARDAIFNQLESHTKIGAWVITSSSQVKVIEWLADRFQAEIIYLSVDESEAHRRAEVDKRPESWHDYINSWFQRSDINQDFIDSYGQKKARSNMTKKVYTAPLTFKQDGEPGEFKAVFATLNVKDLDGDVTIPGAFSDGQAVIIEPWNHGYELPAGHGKIYANNESAWIEGRFILDTETGRENYQTVKALGDLVQWSYTFNVLDQGPGDFEGEQVNFLRALDTIGVAPVTRGAGLNTRTLAIKSKKTAIPSHDTETTDSAWDGPEMETRVRGGDDLAYYARVYAWRDPEGEEGVKSTYRFIHHMIGEDGSPGAANVRACQTGIGVLNGARGGTTIPEGEREGVYNHLANHLESAGLEAPELKSLSELENQDSAETDPDESKKSRESLLADIDILEAYIIANGIKTEV